MVLTGTSDVKSDNEVQVTPQNLARTTGPEGKTNVPGYGHYHVWIDTAEMPSSLAGLVLMPGRNAFELDLSAWGPGEHSVRVETAQNDHTMYDSASAASFTVIVGDEAAPGVEATPAALQSGTAGAVTVEMTDALRFRSRVPGSPGMMRTGARFATMAGGSPRSRRTEGNPRCPLPSLTRPSTSLSASMTLSTAMMSMRSWR